MAHSRLTVWKVNFDLCRLGPQVCPATLMKGLFDLSSNLWTGPPSATFICLTLNSREAPRGNANVQFQTEGSAHCQGLKMQLFWQEWKRRVKVYSPFWTAIFLLVTDKVHTLLPYQNVWLSIITCTHLRTYGTRFYASTVDNGPWSPPGGDSGNCSESRASCIRTSKYSWVGRKTVF